MRRRPACKEWHVHIGAHKTATTHLQDTLAAVRDALAEQGIAYVPRDVIRTCGGVPDIGAVRQRLLQYGFHRAALPADHWVHAARLHAESLLISEENILGKVSELLTPVLYPRAAHRLATIRALAGGADLTVYLAIRSFETLVPSAYAHRCRWGKARRGDFEAICRRIADRPPRWIELVERILTVVPPERLRVWTYEDYGRDPNRFLSALCANRLSDFPAIPPPRSTRSPSAEAVAALEALPDMPRRDREREASRLCSTDQGLTPFRPFTAEQCAKLDNAYREDLDMIRRRYPPVLPA